MLQTANVSIQNIKSVPKCLITNVTKINTHKITAQVREVFTEREKTPNWPPQCIGSPARTDTFQKSPPTISTHWCIFAQGLEICGEVKVSVGARADYWRWPQANLLNKSSATPFVRDEQYKNVLRRRYARSENTKNTMSVVDSHKK